MIFQVNSQCVCIKETDSSYRHPTAAMAQLQGVQPTASSINENVSENTEGTRAVYARQAELIFSLIGYAVGVGNVWRFPYLTYTYGGGAFLIPYGLSLLFMGVPLFVLELGMGQLTRRGTLGMWTKIGLPRWQGVGLAAILCIWMVGLYYITILAWTIYYLGRTIAAIPSGHLPWSDEISECPVMHLYLHKTVL